MKNLHHSFTVCVSLIAVFLLGACLPDDESVRERKLANFSSTQAAAYAASLSSFAVSSQNSFAAMLADGTPSQGVVNRSSDDAMASGYCILPGSVPNHLLVTWYDTSDNGRNFSIKGLGTGTGASIVQELAQRSLPETVGYFDGTHIKLRGPRENGETILHLPCDLSIPAGAPVVITENMMAPSTQTVEGETYEYQTLACPSAEDIGMLTQRRAVKTNPDGSVSRGVWSDYDTTCDGQISIRSIEVVSGASNNLIGALAGSTGRLQSALEGLQNVQCREVLTRRGQEGDNEAVDDRIADSCDTEIADIIKYTGPDMSHETGKVESTERAEVACGGEPAGSRAFTVLYKGTNYPGTQQYGAWSGTAVYMRHVYEAEYREGGSNETAKTGVRSNWVGDTLSCNRPETMTVSCNQLFPQFRDTTVYIPVNTAGLVLGRTNRIEGWENANELIPNPHLGNNDGWSRQSIGCSWDEVRAFTQCPAGFTLVTPGRNLRRHTITESEDVSVGPWRADKPLQCRQITTSTQQC